MAHFTTLRAGRKELPRMPDRNLTLHIFFWLTTQPTTLELYNGTGRHDIMGDISARAIDPGNSRMSYGPTLQGLIKLASYILSVNTIEQLCEKVFPAIAWQDTQRNHQSPVTRYNLFKACLLWGFLLSPLQTHERPIFSIQSESRIVWTRFHQLPPNSASQMIQVWDVTGFP